MALHPSPEPPHPLPPSHLPSIDSVRDITASKKLPPENTIINYEILAI